MQWCVQDHPEPSPLPNMLYGFSAMGAGGCSRVTGNGTKKVRWPKGGSLGGSPMGTKGCSKVLMTVELGKNSTTRTVSSPTLCMEWGTMAGTNTFSPAES